MYRPLELPALPKTRPIRAQSAAAHRSVGALVLRVVAVALLCCEIGCVNSLKHTIPVQELPPELVGPSRSHLREINFTALGQQAPPAHLTGPEDILGIYVQGVLGGSESKFPEAKFPPTYGTSITGNFMSPAVGIPVTVRPDGTIALPHLAPLPVEGLSLTDVRRRIREAYTDAELLQKGRDVINVTLIKPRSRQVLVIREDSIQRWPILKAPGATLVVKRGNAAAIDLPVYQNDVLHALIQSGGLPGSDAANELWVLHGGQSEHWHAVAAALDGSQDPSKVLSQGAEHARVSRVKLKVLPGEIPEYAPEDVVLDSGDVVYIPSRDAEMYYTGGLLFGQQLTLPRDYELDVLGAIAIAGGSATGPPGWNGAASLFTGNGGPGSILPPTRVLVLRKTPDGGQVAIHVDLKKAIRDGRERLPIQPGDVVLLQYTPAEAAGNFVLNMFRFNAGISRNFVSNVSGGAASSVVNPPPGP